MTTHLFERFKPEYSQWIAVAKIRPEFEHELTIRCQQLLNYKARYAQVSQQTGVPVLWLMPINERESSTNFHTYLGNGDALSRPTRDVPRGRGPFQTWEAGAIDSLRYDHIAGTKDWSPEFMCYEDEVWNGFGYRDRHGIRSPYVVGGLNLQQRGKYVNDGVWSSTAMDTQFGTLAMRMKLLQLDPSLAVNVAATPVLPIDPQQELPPVATTGLVGMKWIQDALNKVDDAHLILDGIFGKRTRTATRNFQSKHPPLLPDGLPGDETCLALDIELAKKKLASSFSKTE